jgi:hypothetical protein
MAKIEFQISTGLLQQAIQDVLEPRLYKLCPVSPVPGLILDRIGIATVGPIVPSPIDVAITVQATIYVVTPQDVIDAGGQAARSSLEPNGVLVSGTVILSMKGATLKGVWGGITHDAHYQQLQSIVAAIVGAKEAALLFGQWEQEIHNALGSEPIIDDDLAKQLPPPFNKAQIGRTAVSGNDQAIAIRLEVGAYGSDGVWIDILLGQFTTFVKHQKWALFISGDVLIQLINNSFSSAIAQAGVPAAVTSFFSEGPPFASQPMPQVDTIIQIPFTVTYRFLGITVESDQGTVQVIATTNFFVLPALVGPGGVPASLNLQLSYDMSVDLGGLISGFIQIFANLSSIAQGEVHFSIPNFTPQGDNTFASSIMLNDITFANFLTLSVTSSRYYELNEAALPDLPPVFNNPQVGMLMEGDANVSATPDVPDCQVTKTDFSVIFVPSQNAGPPSVADTAAFASADIVNASVEGGGSRYPLVIGQFLPVNDSDLLWVGLLPKTPAASGRYTFTLPETYVPAGYFENPYPMGVIVSTNGGARYIDLGNVPQASAAVIAGLLDGVVRFLSGSRVT